MRRRPEASLLAFAAGGLVLPLLIVLALLLLGATHTAPAEAAASSPAATLLALHNAERAKHGLAPLRRSRALERAARRRAREASRRWSHSGYSDAIRAAGFGRWPIAENLAYGTIAGGLATPRSIFRGWMRSPGHRANVLDPELRRVGFGAAVGTPTGARGLTYAAEYGG